MFLSSRAMNNLKSQDYTKKSVINTFKLCFLHKPIQYVFLPKYCTNALYFGKEFSGTVHELLIKTARVPSLKWPVRSKNNLFVDKNMYVIILLKQIMTWIYKRKMMKISTFIYEFGMTRFLKRHDNSCLHIRVTKYRFQREIDRWNVAIMYYMYKQQYLCNLS